MLFLKEVEMQPIRTKYRHLAILLLLFTAGKLHAQNNVGIGTTTPHPSAILEVSDSSRGVLIPRTDTLSVLNYVNTLTPNPGIADGLIIFDINLNTYVYYDLVQDDWKVLLDLVGPVGAKGVTGPTGPMGDTGLVNDWRDSSGFDEIVLKKDTCGDWFFDASNGRVWKLWCDTLGGMKPRKWIDTVLWDKPIGNLTPPDERIFAISLTYSDNSSAFLESMANDSAIVVMKAIPGLNQSITVEPDEVAYIWVSAHGTVGKAFAGSDMSYAQYDLSLGGDEYFRTDNMQSIFSIGANHPVSGRADLVGWHISGQYVFVGDITDPIDCRCGTPYQKATCLCSYGSKTTSITLRGGNRYSASANTSFLILADGPSKETVAHLDVFVIIRRNPKALPRKR